jgi:hypothetical protein
MAVGFLLALQNQCIPLLHSFSSSDTFQSNSFDFFDEFDYGAIGYLFLQKIDFNFETYLPALTVLAYGVQPCSSRKFMFSSC